MAYQRRTGHNSGEARPWGSPTTPSGSRLGTAAGEIVLVLAASLFVLEAAATAYVYSASLQSNFSFVASIDLFGAFWVELGLTLIAVALSIYVLLAVRERLVARLLARWIVQGRVRSTERPTATNGRPAGGWAYDAALAMFGVMFFAESALLAMTLTLSVASGFLIPISTNGVGEFWVEYPLILAAVPLALYILGRSAKPLAGGIRQRRALASGTSNASSRP